MKLLSIRGAIASIVVWAKATGTPTSTIRNRLRKGWSATDAVFGRHGNPVEVTLPWTTVDYLTDGQRIYNTHPTREAADDHAVDVTYYCVTEIRDPSGAVVREFGVEQFKLVFRGESDARD